MLILRRRAGESIVLGGNIEVEVVEIGPTRVKLGVRAPLDLSVLRGEVYQVRSQNRKSLNMTPEQRERIAQHIFPVSPQEFSTSADKTFEARYFGHPERENPDPA